jgi:hypothetical protein
MSNPANAPQIDRSEVLAPAEHVERGEVSRDDGPQLATPLRRLACRADGLRERNASAEIGPGSSGNCLAGGNTPGRARASRDPGGGGGRTAGPSETGSLRHDSYTQPARAYYRAVGVSNLLN